MAKAEGESESKKLKAEGERLKVKDKKLIVIELLVGWCHLGSGCGEEQFEIEKVIKFKSRKVKKDKTRN